MSQKKKTRGVTEWNCGVCGKKNRTDTTVTGIPRCQTPGCKGRWVIGKPKKRKP